MLVESTDAVRAAEESDSRISRPWRWSQQWRDVLFAHWRLPACQVLPHLPANLEVDTWQGMAWVTAVAFRLEEVRLRGLPSLGPVSNLVELNLRTYVRQRGAGVPALDGSAGRLKAKLQHPAIFFFSIHAGSRTAVALARWLTPLPYALARITYNSAGETAQFHCHLGSQTNERPLFQAEFRPTGDTHEVAAESLDAWLLERYFAYVPGRRGRLYRMEVEHPRWQVRGATLDATAQGLGVPWGFDLARQPDLWHFSIGVSAHVWPFEMVRSLPSEKPL